MSDIKDLDKVRYWVQNYGLGDFDDKKNCENFVICETHEIISPLMTQLHLITQGDLDEDLLDRIIGKKRPGKYGSYENWAKLMLGWINDAKKRA